MTALDVLTVLARLLCAGSLCVLAALVVRGARDLWVRGQAPVHSRGRSWEQRPQLRGRL